MRYLKNLFLVLAGVLGISVAMAVPGIAATISKVDRPDCEFSFEGPVEAGDFESFTSALSGALDAFYSGGNQDVENFFFSTTSVCLDSPGGSLHEAIQIGDFINENLIATVVAEGGNCYSACSIIFMMGTAGSDLGNRAARKLHVTANLGLHRPFVDLPDEQSYDADTVEYFFDLANEAILGVIELANRDFAIDNDVVIKPDLMQEMLQFRGQDFFMIDTVGKALRWDIGLFGFRQPRLVDAIGAMRLCDNMFLLSTGYGEEYFFLVDDRSHGDLTDASSGRAAVTLVTRDDGRAYFYEVMRDGHGITRAECLVGATRWDDAPGVGIAACGGSWTGHDNFPGNAFCLVNQPGDFDLKGGLSNPDLMQSVPAYAMFPLSEKLVDLPAAARAIENRVMSSPHLPQIAQSLAGRECVDGSGCGPAQTGTADPDVSVDVATWQPEERPWQRVVGVASDDVLWVRACPSSKCEKLGYLAPGQSDFFITECEGKWCLVHDATDRALGWAHSRYMTDAF